MFFVGLRESDGNHQDRMVFSFPRTCVYRWVPDKRTRIRTEPAPSELLKSTGMQPNTRRVEPVCYSHKLSMHLGQALSLVILVAPNLKLIVVIFIWEIDLPKNTNLYDKGHWRNMLMYEIGPLVYCYALFRADSQEIWSIFGRECW